ncbi:SGNH hydrolase domain-containing protein [Demequina phytophila]|uniref:SGNH hydrolase domain-containing protein n=1 Tax=Demequina phytophila TaxID=1638981 RepID=UPI000784C1AE|nr:SGNH hydrolase domain-containing protein [Demequina phytophila]
MRVGALTRHRAIVATSMTAVAAVAVAFLPAPSAAAADVCVGAQAMSPYNACVTDTSRALTPSPSKAEDDVPAAIYADACRSGGSEARVKACTFGDPKGTVKAVLIGDSHAANWFPAVHRLAKKHGWDLTVHFKAGCTWNAKALTWKGTAKLESCASWNTRVTKALLADPPGLIITTALVDNQFGAGEQGVQTAVAGYATNWQRLKTAGSAVVPIVDTPWTSDTALACMARSHPETRNCGTKRRDALTRANVMAMAAQQVDGVKAVNLNSYFCKDGFCPSAIGSITVYRDRGHLTRTYMSTVAPYLNNRIPERFYAAKYR